MNLSEFVRYDGLGLADLIRNKEVTAKELAEFVASKIARYKKPQYVDFVDALPKTEDGEIDRDQVKKEHGGKY